MSTRPSFVKGANCAVILKYGSVDQAIVKGLNKLGLPALTRNMITIEEFGRDFAFDVAGGGKYGSISFGGNMVLGDTKGQDQIKAYLRENAEFSDARCYLNANDFLACDLAKDPGSFWQVAEYTPGEVDKNGVFSLSGQISVGGDFAVFTKHLAGSTIALVKGATSSDADTVTDSGDGFVDAGFEPGMTLIWERGSTISYHLIKTVADGVLTLESKSTVTGATSGTSTTLHGGRL